jgi:hypothetical protein
VERHGGVLGGALAVDYLSEGIETADQRPVGVDAAAAGIEKDTAPVGFIAKDNPAFFCIDPIDLGGGYLEIPGQTKSLIGSNPDSFVMAAGAADLALKRKKTALFQVEDECGGMPGLIHFCFEPFLPEERSERSRIVL